MHGSRDARKSVIRQKGVSVGDCMTTPIIADGSLELFYRASKVPQRLIGVSETSVEASERQESFFRKRLSEHFTVSGHPGQPYPLLADNSTLLISQRYPCPYWTRPLPKRQDVSSTYSDPEEAHKAL